MKRLSLIFSAIALMLASAGAQITTPNMGLTLPAHGTPNWDGVINADFSLLDSAYGQIVQPFQGSWSSGATYAKGQWVVYLGTLYISLVNSNAGNIPSSSPSQWSATITPVSNTTEPANTVYAGLSSGSAALPSFRNLVLADLPAINFSNITGSVASSQLPSPSASALGGIESFASTPHVWINQISTSGVPSGSQPTASDLSNGTSGSGAVCLVTSCSMATPSLNNPSVTSGSFASPIINGTPSGTGIQTTTVKQGTGAGNYTTTTTSNCGAQVDSASLLYSVIVPLGWKLIAQASATVETGTAATSIGFCLTDSGTILDENSLQTSAASTTQNITAMAVINGDGNSHSVDMRWNTGNASDAAIMINNSGNFRPIMMFVLTPSN